jgi:hypothetical protein
VALDDEFLGVLALELESVPAGAIDLRRGGALGGQTLRAVPACLGEEGLAVMVTALG